jgi:hypothetical protein
MGVYSTFPANEPVCCRFGQRASRSWLVRDPSAVAVLVQAPACVAAPLSTTFQKPKDVRSVAQYSAAFAEVPAIYTARLLDFERSLCDTSRAFARNSIVVRLGL